MEEIKEQATSPSGYEAEKPAPKSEEPYDEYGYPKTDAPAEKEIVAATGYDEKAPEAPKEEPKKETASETAAEAAKELDIDVKDLPEDDAKSVKEFAKKHGITKEVAQAMADMKKAEHKELNDALENRRIEIEQKKKQMAVDWHNELKNDPTFGGEKFAYNIKQAEKVIDQFMPNLKSRLLQDKQMLPPYVMKDLAKLAKHLYSTEKLTQGEPIVQTKANDDVEDHLAFYT
jgi:hypothetical protein